MRHTKDEIRQAKIHAALGQPARLRLISHLALGPERTVTEIVQRTKLPQPMISTHLAILRRAGLVTCRRDGRWSWYKTTAAGDQMAGLVLP